jgi:hypothetical protein
VIDAVELPLHAHRVHFTGYFASGFLVAVFVFAEVLVLMTIQGTLGTR